MSTPRETVERALAESEEAGAISWQVLAKDALASLAQHREGIARAIHDGASAQEQYRRAGIPAHAWQFCPYKDQYRADADAALAYLTGEAAS